MARTLSQIFNEAKAKRQEYLRLNEINNPSQMSILDAITWITSSCIWSFENLLDVFQVQVAEDINNRVNGTPGYYAQALLRYQKGDSLVVSEDGTSVSYANIDESKRIISKVSYQESESQNFFDNQLLLKIVQGQPGSYSQIEEEDMAGIKNYISQIAFAGTQINVVSRKGDVLVPRVVVYYDGGIGRDELMNNIVSALNQFAAGLEFDNIVYAQKVIDALQAVGHVNDVQCAGTYVSGGRNVDLGVYVAQYDDDNIIGDLTKIDRFVFPNSGYVKQSTGRDQEAAIDTWKQSIFLEISNPSSPSRVYNRI